MAKGKKSQQQKSILQIDVSIGGVSFTQKALFAKHMSVMLKAGLSLTEALGTAGEAGSGKFKKVVGKVRGSVESGHSLADAFAAYPKVFPSFLVSVTKAGEASGTLVENLENVAEQLKKEQELASKIKGAMIYPIVVLAAAFALGMGISFLVLPRITPLFEGLQVDLPFTTRVLISFSHIIQSHGIYLFGGIVVGVIFFLWLIRQKFSRPVTNWLLLHTPIIKRIVRYSNLARFCRSLGMLLQSGLNIDESLEITKNTVGNYYYQRAVAKISKNIQAGTKLSENLEEHSSLFPIIVTRMVKVGEQSGKFEDTLFYLADFYEAEVDNATKSLTTALEPILLLVIGGVVGFLALSIITPIYDITGNIRR
jgi:type II secretory pathway component PulF